MKIRLDVIVMAVCLLFFGRSAFADGPTKKIDAKPTPAPSAQDSTLSNFEIMQLANDADPDKGKRTAFAVYLLSASYGEKIDRDGCETKETVKASCASLSGSSSGPPNAATDSSPSGATENSAEKACRIEITSTCAVDGVFSSEWIAFRIKKADADEDSGWTVEARTAVRGGT